MALNAPVINCDFKSYSLHNCEYINAWESLGPMTNRPVETASPQCHGM